MASLLREKDVVVKVVVVFDGVCDVVFLSSPFLLRPKKTMCVRFNDDDDDDGGSSLTMMRAGNS